VEETEMNRIATLLVVGLTLILLFARPAPAQSQAAFPDVPPSDRILSDAVRDLAAKGILHGLPDGRFGGDQVMTRGDCFVAFNRILQWFYGQPVNTPSPYPRVPSSVPLPAPKVFADVPADWDSEMGSAISILDHIGLLNGYPDQTLKLQRPMTREEFTVVRERLLRWMEQEMVLLGFARPEATAGGSAPK
jgi:hypothetical protein